MTLKFVVLVELQRGHPHLALGRVLITGRLFVCGLGLVLLCDLHLNFTFLAENLGSVLRELVALADELLEAGLSFADLLFFGTILPASNSFSRLLDLLVRAA